MDHNIDPDTGQCRVCGTKVPPEGEVYCPGAPPEKPPRGKPPSFLDDDDAIGQRLKELQAERAGAWLYE